MVLGLCAGAGSVSDIQAGESDTQPKEWGMAVPVLGANAPGRRLAFAEDMSN